MFFTLNATMLQFPLPAKWFKNEAEFTIRFGKQIKEHWGFWHKISDMSIELKPFDWILAISWYVAAIEIKTSDNKCKIDVEKMLRPNQKTGLRKFKKNWWNALVCYYSKTYNKYFIRNIDDNLIIDLK